MEEAIPFESGMFSWNARVPNGNVNTNTRSRVYPIGRETTLATGDEMAPLIKGNRRQPVVDFRTTTAVIMCGTVTLWVLLFVLVGTIYFNFNGTMNAYRAEFRPYVHEAFNHTMSILRNTDDATFSAHNALHGAQELSDRAVPAIERALNQSSAMIDRLERLAQNPVLQISMQQGGVGR